MAETGRIRKKRNKFSQVSNHCLRNDKLTLKAKGLYALIQSFIDIPDFTLYKSVLMDKYCVEGREAFNNTWKELINAGYLKTYKVNTHNGFVYEYELLDEPEEEETPETPNDEGSGVEERNPITTKVRQLSPGTENPYVGPGTAFPGVDSPGVGNPSLNNTNNKYTNNKYTDLSNNNELLDIIKNFNKDSVVVQNNVLNKLTTNEIKKQIAELETAYYKANVDSNCLESDFVKDVLSYNEYAPKYFSEFKIQCLGGSTKIKMFNAEAILKEFELYCEVYGNTDMSKKGVDLLNTAFESFSNADRLSILNFSNETVGELYLIAMSIYQKDDEGTPVFNKQAYMSQIVRSYVAKNNTALFA